MKPADALALPSTTAQTPGFRKPFCVPKIDSVGASEKFQSSS
jgi:hypothetical protein